MDTTKRDGMKEHITSTIEYMLSGGKYSSVLYLEEEDEDILYYELSSKGIADIMIYKSEAPIVLDLNTEEQFALAESLITCDGVSLIDKDNDSVIKDKLLDTNKINVFTSFAAYKKVCKKAEVSNLYRKAIKSDSPVIIINTDDCNPAEEEGLYYEFGGLEFIDPEQLDDADYEDDDKVSWEFGLINDINKMKRYSKPTSY